MTDKTKTNETEESKRDERSDTDRGYDEAARSGESRYGVPSGSGGVFGTSGGGSSEAGMQVEERPMPYVYPEDKESEKE